MNEKIQALLSQSKIFENLHPEEMTFIFEHLKERPFNKGDILFEEGDKSSYLGIVFEGSLDILKNGFKIVEVGPMGLFGEFAFLDEKERSATAKAKSSGLAFLLFKEEFSEKLPMVQDLYRRLAGNFAPLVIARMRETNQKYTESLVSQLHLLDLRTRFGRFFIQVIIIFGVCSFFDSLARTFSLNIYSLWFNWVYLMALLIPILISAWHFRFTLQDAGITLRNWKKSLIEGLVGSGIVLGLFALFQKSFADVMGDARLSDPLPLILWLPLTAIHDYTQEFMARGVAQTILQRFLGDEKGIRTVMVIALLFGILHLHLGYFVAGVAFLMSIVLGLLYIRSYNLIGVGLLHTSFDLIGYWLSVI